MKIGSGKGLLQRVDLFACIVLLLPMLACAQDDRKPLQLDVAGEVAINTDGTVYQHNIATIVTPEIKAVLDKAIAGWRFEPVVRNGRAVPAKSSVYLTLSALPVDTGYRLRIDRVRFGGNRSMIRGTMGFAYPRDAIRAKASAELQLAVRIDAEGKVLDVAAIRSRLLNLRGREKDLERVRRSFEQAAVAAMRKARYAPADVANGEGEVTVITSLMYCVEVDCQSLVRPGWRVADGPDASRPIPWLPAERQQFDADGLRDGQSIALDAGIKLKEDVAGTSL
jgi:hypothetical protein